MLIFSPLSSIILSSIILIFLVDTCQNSFSYNYLKTIQIVLVHISEAF